MNHIKSKHDSIGLCRLEKEDSSTKYIINPIRAKLCNNWGFKSFDNTTVLCTNCRHFSLDEFKRPPKQTKSIIRGGKWLHPQSFH